MSLRVAGAQIPVLGSVDVNQDTILNALDFAIDNNADILLTPEGSLSGYFPAIDQARVTGALDVITAKAKDARVGLALGTCFVEPGDGKVYNQVRFYDKDGTFLGFHAKTLRTTGESKDYAPAPLRAFDFHGTCIGGLICNDMWANPGCTDEDDPHLTRKLASMGVKIIFHAVNGGRNKDAFMKVITSYHESNLQMRAQADKVYIVTVDNCFPFSIPCSAPSGVVSPDGTWAVKVPGEGEQYFTFDISLP